MSSAMTIAASLVSREQTRARSKMRAYHNIGSRIGMSAAWVRKLVAGGVHSIDAAVRDRLHALLIRELEAEIERLTHELEIARRTGAPLAGEQVGEVEAYLQKARTLLRGENA